MESLPVEASSHHDPEMIDELFEFLDDWSDRYAKTQAGDGSRPDTATSLIPLPTRSKPLFFADREERYRQQIIQMAAQAYAERRLRDEVFDSPGLFSEPAWDILLDLAAAEATGNDTSTSSVCIGACVPDTTALRWIAVLEKRGLVRREADLADKRRTFLRLTRDGAEKIGRYFTRLARFRSRGR